MELSDAIKMLSHNSYCVVGGQTEKDRIIDLLESAHGIPIQGNPDFFSRDYDSFTIDDAREMKSFHETVPISSAGKKIFIVRADAILVEAQNALLKLLEEPAQYAHFFLIIPSAHQLIPTVRSRLNIIPRKGGIDLDPNTAIEFIGSSKTERLKTVASLVDDIKNEKKKKRDAIEFIDMVEKVVYEERGAKDGKDALQAIATARRYLNDRSPSLKMLLEYVALNA